MIRQLPVIRQIKQVKPPRARRDELSRWRNKARPEDKDGRVRGKMNSVHLTRCSFCFFCFLLAVLAPQPAFCRGSGSDVNKNTNAAAPNVTAAPSQPLTHDCQTLFFDASRRIFCTIYPPPPTPLVLALVLVLAPTRRRFDASAATDGYCITVAHRCRLSSSPSDRSRRTTGVTINLAD